MHGVVYLESPLQGLMLCAGAHFPLLNAWSLKQCALSEFFEEEEFQDSELVDFQNSPLLCRKGC